MKGLFIARSRFFKEDCYIHGIGSPEPGACDYPSKPKDKKMPKVPQCHFSCRNSVIL
jgi:hypothetical protein